jgi:hypothetical protein
MLDLVAFFWGLEFELQNDVPLAMQASFLRLLPLRSMSRFWGSLMGVVCILGPAENICILSLLDYK